MKMELGLNGPLLQHDPAIFLQLASPSWIRFTWTFLRSHDICVTDDLPDFPLKQREDFLLIVEFACMQLPPSELYKLNVCRVHLRVISMSDISDGAGIHILDSAWKGYATHNWNLSYHWPTQPRPPDTFWASWTKALRLLCSRHGLLRNPLGGWTEAGSRLAIWWYDPVMQDLFKRSGSETVSFAVKSHRTTRNASLRFLASSFAPMTIPITAQPCVIETQGAFLVLHGLYPYGDSAPSCHPQSFTQYISSRQSEAWIFDNIQISGSLAALADSIRLHTCSCVTDGSFKDGHGTAAWKIVDHSMPNNILEGQCITLGSLAQQNAYRSEVSGLYASVIAVNAIIEFFKIESGSITLACDNSSAICMTSFAPSGTNPTCADFDLIMAVQYLKSPKILWNHLHVDGHMDGVPGHVLNPLEEINVDMDKKTKIFWSQTHDLEQRRHHFEGEPWSVYLGGHKEVSHLTSQIKAWCQRPRIHEYWIRKNQFPEIEIAHLDLDTAGTALKSVLHPHVDGSQNIPVVTAESTNGATDGNSAMILSAHDAITP